MSLLWWSRLPLRACKVLYPPRATLCSADMPRAPAFCTPAPASGPLHLLLPLLSLLFLSASQGFSITTQVVPPSLTIYLKKAQPLSKISVYFAVFVTSLLIGTGRVCAHVVCLSPLHRMPLRGITEFVALVHDAPLSAWHLLGRVNQ